MIKFDHFSRFQKDFRQKMQGLHKIDHNSRKKLKTQGWKTQNSSKKLKVSAKSKTRFAENRSKKKAGLIPSFVAISLCSESLPFLQEPPTLGMGTPPEGKQVYGVQQGVAPKPFAHATPSLKQSVISFASWAVNVLWKNCCKASESNLLVWATRTLNKTNVGSNLNTYAYYALIKT